MRIAYLINRYPAASHTFIRREINALERLGATITRFSIRQASEDFLGTDDETEAGLTTAILGAPKMQLLFRVLLAVIQQPGAAARTLSDSWRMTRGGDRRFVRAVACWVEACWLSHRLRAARTDHLHAHFGTNSAAVARLTARLARIPYSLTIHGPEEFDNVEALDLRGKVTDAAFTVAVSSFGRSQICRFISAEIRPRVHVVRCGLDIVGWHESTRGESDSSDLCFVGRLAPQKGLHTLVQALAILKDRGVPVRTLIIGSGDLSAELKEECDSAGIAACVTFAGVRQGAAVATAMRNAKIVVVPSYAEGLPVVIMEALAAGVPVISTFIAGIPELIDDSCGKLVPAGDAPVLAGAIEQMLAVGSDHRREMGEAGRKRVAEYHDIDRNARRLNALFEQYSVSVR